MNDGYRCLFLFLATIILFAAHMSMPATASRVRPDELIYGCQWTGIMNASIYSTIPCFFGRQNTRIANAFFASATIIPLFYLFRKGLNERNASIAATLASFLPSLWAYAGLNMTEPLYTLVVLSFYAFAQLRIGLLAPLIKPLGVIPLITHHFPVLFLVAFDFIILLRLLITGYYFETAYFIVRGSAYLALASFMTAPILAAAKGFTKEKSFIAASILVYAWLGADGLMTGFAYGRYMDVPAILCITLIPQTIRETDLKKALPWLVLALILAIIFFFIMFSSTGYILDSGIRWDVFRKLGAH